MNKGIIAFSIFVLLAIGFWLYFYPILPNVMSSHFDSYGNANAYMSKTGFLTLFSAILICFTFLFLIFMPLIFPKIPTRFINLPNKNYWLSPENKNETTKYIVGIYQAIGIGTGIFLLVSFYLTISANTNGSNHLPMHLFITVSSLYFLFIIYIVVKSLLKFAKKSR